MPESITATRTRGRAGGIAQASNARLAGEVPLLREERIVGDERSRCRGEGENHHERGEGDAGAHGTRIAALRPWA